MASSSTIYSKIRPCARCGSDFRCMTLKARYCATCKPLARREWWEQRRQNRIFSVGEQYREYKRNAFHRGIDFRLTRREFASFAGRPCAYCGGTQPRIGLDRIDSGGAYALANVTSCCTPCNRMKASMSVEAFVGRCSVIASRFSSLAE